MASAILVALALPVFAVQYNPGVTAGQYVKYGNFVGSGPGYESFSDYGFLNLQVVSVSGNTVTLLSTGNSKTEQPFRVITPQIFGISKPGLTMELQALKDQL
jgi:hypothetical protein